MIRFYFIGEQPFAVVTGRGIGGSDIKGQTHLAFSRIRAELESLGSGLDDLVRMAVYTRDQECRPAVSEVRKELFPGSARPASSSLIVHDLRDTMVQVEAIALLHPGRALSRRGIEFDPPRPHVKALLADDFLILSGTGGQGEELESQTRSALDTIDSYIRELGSADHRLFRLTFYVRRSESVEVAYMIARHRVGTGVPMDFTLCDEFARPEMLVEIEGSACRP